MNLDWHISRQSPDLRGQVGSCGGNDIAHLTRNREVLIVVFIPNHDIVDNKKTASTNKGKR